MTFKADHLKSQFVTSNRGGVRKLPLAFTEQGVAMLCGILSIDRAVDVNIIIMRAFVQLRHIAVEHAGLKREVEVLRKQTEEPRVRLVTVLTDAPFIADAPPKNRCGNCMLCRDACPAGAIKGVNTENHYTNRNDALHFSRCVEKLTGEFAKLPEVGAPVCGVCIKVCPFGRKRHDKA